MKIDKALNLVIPIYGDDVPKLDGTGKPVIENGKPVMVETVVAYVHSTPISRETFEKYFLPISQTFSAIFNQGLGAAGGPAVALLLLKERAQAAGVWEGPDGVERGLVDDMRRLTTVIAQREGGGWEQVPLAIATARGMLNKEDVAEVENAIAFFIVNSAMLRRAQRRPMLETAADLWSARISSSTPTEFTASLPTSTGTGNSGASESAPAAGPQKQAPRGATVVVDGKPSSLPV